VPVFVRVWRVKSLQLVEQRVHDVDEKHEVYLRTTKLITYRILNIYLFNISSFVHDRLLNGC